VTRFFAQVDSTVQLGVPVTVENVNWPRVRDQLLVALAAVALLWVATQVIGRVTHIIVVVLLAMVLAYALEPALKSAERYLPRMLAAILIYVLALAMLAAAILVVGPTAIAQGEALAERLPGYLDQVSHYAPAAGVDLGGQLRSLTASALSSVVTLVETVAGGVVDTALVLILGFWFMVDGRRIPDLVTRLSPVEQRDKVRFVQDTVSQVLGAYIRGQLTTAAIIGVSAGVGSALLGVHYALLIGILAFLFELIPMVGPILGSLPAILISVFQPFPLVLEVIAFFIAMQLFENNILAPRVTGGAVGLHPGVALLSIVIGADIGGVVGALFAVPVAGIVSVLVAAIYKGWRGEPIVVERAGMWFRLPRRRVST
jgi:predicted PurR-regulated permease PerM